MTGWRCRVGLVTPPDNLLIEPELNALAPPGVSIHSTRLRDIDLETMPDEAVVEARNYGDTAVDVVVYACNVSSFHEGPGHDEAIAGRLSTAAGRPATTASTAMVRALEALDAERLAVVTPYDADENELLREFLRGNGFHADSMGGLGLTSTDLDQVRRLTDRTATDTYRQVVDRDDPDADAVLVTATNLPSVGAIPSMEADLGKPVVAANVAILWHACGLAGVEPVNPAGGTLLDADGPGFEAARD